VDEADLVAIVHEVQCINHVVEKLPDGGFGDANWRTQALLLLKPQFVVVVKVAQIAYLQEDCGGVRLEVVRKR
jgi:hypothetical protein